LLILFVFLIEHKVEPIRTATVGFGAHGGVACEGTKNNGRTAR
jgi:hypothetical protein